MSTVPVVDGHTHVWATWPYRPGVPDPQTRGSAENLLQEMDSSGVDHALVVSARDRRRGRQQRPRRVSRRAAPRPVLAARRPRQPLRPGLPPAGIGGPPPRGGRPVCAGRGLALPRRRGRRLARVDRGGRLPCGGRGGRRRRQPRRPAGVGTRDRGAARRHPGVTILLNHLGTVMLHPGGLEEGLRLVVDDEDTAQPRRQGLRLGLRHRPALGLPVCGPARRRPPLPRGVGSGPAGLGIGLAVAAAAPQLPPGPGAPHGARHLPQP